PAMSASGLRSETRMATSSEIFWSEWHNGATLPVPAPGEPFCFSGALRKTRLFEVTHGEPDLIHFEPAGRWLTGARLLIPIASSTCDRVFAASHLAVLLGRVASAPFVPAEKSEGVRSGRGACPSPMEFSGGTGLQRGSASFDDPCQGSEVRL